jgi:prolyl 4-hydroxylase
MTEKQMTPELRARIVEHAKAGRSPEALLQLLTDDGWEAEPAIEAAEAVMRDFLTEHARENALPEPVRVPAPVGLNGPSVLQIDGREIQVLSSLLHPRVIVFGNLLSHAECDAIVELARSKLSRSSVVNVETGADQVHHARTSEGMSFTRGANEMCQRIEARIATLMDWPLENGEGLQVLRYGPGAQYEPHYDYFDPAQSGFQSILKRGGQRVASLVMYLNTPKNGGATVFPDAKFEVGAVKGNAVFFSYDRPHPMTRTLHGGAPVVEGEKWVATKWLREGPHT